MEDKIEKKIQERDSYFDNLKAILIFLVVIGHLIEIGIYKNNIFKGIWYAIYSFHMPLFIFIAGYFTKYSEQNARKAIKNYLIPYIIFDILIYIFRVIVLKENIEFQLLMPQYGMWFLISIFWYKLIYNGVYKIKGIFVISIILAILVGLDKSFTNLAAFSRTIVFFPFFIIGTRFKKEYLIADKKWLKAIFIITILILLILFGYICMKLKMPIDLLRQRTPYESLNIGILKAAIARTCILAFGFGIIYMILNIIPTRKLPISYIGQNTIITYIVHIFIILYCKSNNILDGGTYKTLILIVIATVMVIVITTLPIIKKAYDYLLNKIGKLLNI